MGWPDPYEREIGALQAVNVKHIDIGEEVYCLQLTCVKNVKKNSVG